MESLLSVIFVKLVIVPTWGTTVMVFYNSNFTDFNPRPRVGDDRGLRRLRRLSEDFNPRPHVGDDESPGNICASFKISIHVPM